MKIYKFATCAMLALFVTHGPAAAGSLSGDAIKSLMSGKSVSWVTSDGTWKGVSKYNRNGSATVNINAPEKSKDAGKWWVSGNQFCSQWTNLRDGQAKCWDVETTSQDGVYRLDNVFIRVN